MFLFRRHQARYQSERVATTNSDNSSDGTTTTTIITGPSAPPAVTTVASHDSHNGDEEEGTFMNSNQSIATAATTPIINRSARAQSSGQPRVIAMGDTDDDDEDDASDDEIVDRSEGITRHSFRSNLSLADLEEERELARRRSSACLLFALFILFRLWIFALQDGDFGLLLLCVMASSWTARWIRHNREQEEELDRRIANYIQNAQNGGNNDGGEGEQRHDNLRMLSFQAQLALAIMESQRQMMQGGYGHPDGDGNQNPGVSDVARSKWKKFEYNALSNNDSQGRGSYGSVAQGDMGTKAGSSHGGEEEPHCSICLGEYEEGEELCTLPCGHVYHNDCIGSWCSNHTRCPLCNTDLESVTDNEAN